MAVPSSRSAIFFLYDGFIVPGSFSVCKIARGGVVCIFSFWRSAWCSWVG